jgi:Putative adhesin
MRPDITVPDRRHQLPAPEPTPSGGITMPAFDTPEPISVTIELGVGDVRIAASDRADTVVDVRPSDDRDEHDVRAAEQTRVEYTAGRLLVMGPKQRGLGLFSKPGSVDVTIELPAGSRLQGDTGVAAFHCVGHLGACRVKTGVGDIAIDRLAGPADITTGTGQVRLGQIDGGAVIKNSNGDCWVGEITGDLRAHSSNGDISVGRTGAGVAASTAYGDVRIGEVTRGAASLKTSFGEIEIGIRAGTAARLDVSTKFGRVLNDLAAGPGPGASDETAEVHASTSYGDILIRRSSPQDL